MNTIRYSLIAAGLLGAASLTTPTALQAQRSGVDIWSQNCGKCHTFQPPNRYTANNWETIMVSMAQTARLTDQDADAVLEFLKGGAMPVASGRPQKQERPLVVLASAAPMALSFPATADSATNYSNLCVACHGKQGKGNGPAAVAFNPKPASFVDAVFQTSRTDDQLADVISKGQASMPGFATQLTPQEVRALVAYVRGLAPQGDK